MAELQHEAARTKSKKDDNGSSVQNKEDWPDTPKKRTPLSMLDEAHRLPPEKYYAGVNFEEVRQHLSAMDKDSHHRDWGGCDPKDRPGRLVAAAIHCLERQLGHLQGDVPGWEGNSVYSNKCLDEKKAEQFNCMARAEQALNALHELQRRKVIRPDFEARLAMVDGELLHEVLTVQDKSPGGQGYVVDAWAEEFPVVFAASDLKDALEAASRDVARRSQLYGEKVERFKNNFVPPRGLTEQHCFSEVYTAEKDYLFARLFANPAAPRASLFRGAINPSFFNEVKEHLASCVPPLFENESKVRHEIRAALTLSELQPYVDKYFGCSYPNDGITKALLGRRPAD